MLERLVTLHSTTWLLPLTFVCFKGFGMPKVQATCPLSSLDGFQESLWGATMTWWLAIKDYIHQDHVMLSSLWALFVYHGSCIHTWAHVHVIHSWVVSPKSHQPLGPMPSWFINLLKPSWACVEQFHGGSCYGMWMYVHSCWSMHNYTCSIMFMASIKPMCFGLLAQKVHFWQARLLSCSCMCN